MTTEADIVTRTWPLLRAGMVALCVWLGLIIGLTVLVEPSRDAIVFGSPMRTLALLDNSDTRILSVGPNHLVVRGVERGFVRALYANGAWVVLPARAGGCLNLARWLS
jgi:hypothetical protein